MKELFEKVYIRSEADLPKEKINVFMYDEKNHEGFYVTINPLDIGQKEHLPNAFTWYLQSVPPPTDEVTEIWESIIEYKGVLYYSKNFFLNKPTDEEVEKSIPYPDAVSKHQTDINIGWIRGVKALRDGKIK